MSLYEFGTVVDIGYNLWFLVSPLKGPIRDPEGNWSKSKMLDMIRCYP